MHQPPETMPPSSVNAELVIRRDEAPLTLLTLNRPDMHNAFDIAMGDALAEHLRDVDEDPGIRVCILAGEGDTAFTSGANLQDPSAHAAVSVEEALRSQRTRKRPSFFDDILAFRKPIICAVNGHAIGAGLLIPLCCDIVLASTTAKFKMTQTRLGVIPSFAGTARLAQWVGRGRAMEIALSGRSVQAEEAERIGLVSRVVPPNELLLVARQMASQLAQQSELALALAKESFLQVMEDSMLHEAARTDLYRLLTLVVGEDSKTIHEEWRALRDERKSSE